MFFLFFFCKLHFYHRISSLYTKYKFNITVPSCLQFYRVVLVIPDVFDKNHIREMMDILVSKLGFSSAIIHQVRQDSIHVLVNCTAILTQQPTFHFRVFKIMPNNHQL